MTPFPPPPWRLEGEAVLVWCGGGRGLLLARYDEGATLAYHELIAFSGLRRRGRFVGFDVGGIWVDSAASRDGGRAIWGLPKELATFRWTSERVTVGAEDGSKILAADLRRAPVRMPVPLLPAVFGRRGERELWTASFGTLRGGPAWARVAADPSSPVAALGLTGSFAAIAGDRLRLPFPRPRRVPRGTA